MAKTILSIFGTRPEAIKMCPLVTEIDSRSDMDSVVCVTGQHRQMLDSVLDAFDVKPDFDLDIMKERQTLFDITCGVVSGIAPVLTEVSPDVVLVHGDTTTSFAASLAAFYLGIPIGHVEAGLRTRNLRSPFPEEFNRQAVDIVTDYLFAPTKTACENLLLEQKDAGRIYVVGNTGIDALKTTVRNDYSHPLLDWSADSRLVLVTAHRRENIGRSMHDMFKAIRRVVDSHGDVKVIYPIHLNPAVREVAYAEFEGCDRVRLTEPLDVLDFHNFMAKSYMILTDSGGVQEEAPALGKPVLVMRDTTERPEGIAAGTLKLAGTSEDAICKEFSLLLDDEDEYEKMARAINPYGDGNTSSRIASILASGDYGPFGVFEPDCDMARPEGNAAGF